MAENTIYKTVWEELYGDNLSLLLDKGDNGCFLKITAQPRDLQEGELMVYLTEEEIHGLRKALKKVEKIQKEEDC